MLSLTLLAGCQQAIEAAQSSSFREAAKGGQRTDGELRLIENYTCIPDKADVGLDPQGRLTVVIAYVPNSALVNDFCDRQVSYVYDETNHTIAIKAGVTTLTKPPELVDSPDYLNNGHVGGWPLKNGKLALFRTWTYFVHPTRLAPVVAIGQYDRIEDAAHRFPVGRLYATDSLLTRLNTVGDLRGLIGRLVAAKDMADQQRAIDFLLSAPKVKALLRKAPANETREIVRMIAAGDAARFDTLMGSVDDTYFDPQLFAARLDAVRKTGDGAALAAARAMAARRGAPTSAKMELERAITYRELGAGKGIYDFDVTCTTGPIGKVRYVNLDTGWLGDVQVTCTVRHKSGKAIHGPGKVYYAVVNANGEGNKWNASVYQQEWTQGRHSAVTFAGPSTTFTFTAVTMLARSTRDGSLNSILNAFHERPVDETSTAKLLVYFGGVTLGNESAKGHFPDSETLDANRLMVDMDIRKFVADGGFLDKARRERSRQDERSERARANAVLERVEYEDIKVQNGRHHQTATCVYSDGKKVVASAWSKDGTSCVSPSTREGACVIDVSLQAILDRACRATR